MTGRDTFSLFGLVFCLAHLGWGVASRDATSIALAAMEASLFGSLLAMRRPMEHGQPQPVRARRWYFALLIDIAALAICLSLMLTGPSRVGPWVSAVPVMLLLAGLVTERRRYGLRRV